MFARVPRWIAGESSRARQRTEPVFSRTETQTTRRGSSIDWCTADRIERGCVVTHHQCEAEEFYRLANVFQRHRAEIDDRNILKSSCFSDLIRADDLPRKGLRSDPRRKIHGGTKYVTLALNGLTEMEPRA
jgi:hypothetical protein